MSKIAKTIRLDKSTIDIMNLLKSYYEKKLGIKISQADLLTIVLKNDYEKIIDDTEQYDLFNKNI